MPRENCNTFMTKSVYLSYLPCINKFGLPPSASCLVDRNVNDKECLNLYWFQRDVHDTTSYLKFGVMFTITKYSEKSPSYDGDLPFSVRNDLDLGRPVAGGTTNRAGHAWSMTAVRAGGASEKFYKSWGAAVHKIYCWPFLLFAPIPNREWGKSCVVIKGECGGMWLAERGPGRFMFVFFKPAHAGPDCGIICVGLWVTISGTAAFRNSNRTGCTLRVTEKEKRRENLRK